MRRRVDSRASSTQGDGIEESRQGHLTVIRRGNPPNVSGSMCMSMYVIPEVTERVKNRMIIDFHMPCILQRDLIRKILEHACWREFSN